MHEPFLEYRLYLAYSDPLLYHAYEADYIGKSGLKKSILIINGLPDWAYKADTMRPLSTQGNIKQHTSITGENV